MSNEDAVNSNRAAWDQIANDEDRWFRAITAAEMDAAKRGDWRIKVTPTRDVPRDWFGDLDGADVLALAAGGGQQSPILAAAGARVTVVDFSERQLARDLKAAAEFGYSVNVLQADMADLSCLESQSFDLILNPTSVCYIPDVAPVWDHCYRVLRPGGRLIAGFMLPVNFLFDPFARDQHQLIVQNAIPYADLALPKDDQDRLLSPVLPAEFGHSLTTLIGGQLKTGLGLVGFYTDRWGDSDPVSDHLDVFGATLSIRLR